MTFGQAVLINVGLLGLFALQHSVMARPAFKRWWTTLVPPPVERSTYVPFSNLALSLVFRQWQPMGGVIWHIENSTGRLLLYGLFAFGWLLVLVLTFPRSITLISSACGKSTFTCGGERIVAEICHPGALQTGAAFAGRWLVLRVLGDADDDCGASGVCAANYHLHPDRYSPRRTRFARGA
jgi:hypothetical protein